MTRRKAMTRRSKHRREHTLARKAAHALGFSFTNNALAKLATVGVGVVLARMLGPHSFGTYAVAYVASRVLVNLNDLGVNLAIVRWPGEPAEITPTVTSISVVASVACYTGCFFGAPWYAAAMGAPGATGVVRVVALVVVIDALAATPAGVLQRHFRQDLRIITDQVNVWLGTGLTMLLAWLNYGAMSLAIGRVAGCAAALVLLMIFSPLPLRAGFSRAVARPLLRFGAPLAASGMIVFAVGNADQLVAGRTLGVTTLGLFVLASNLSSWPVSMFSQPVRNVAPAAFARLRGNPVAMRRGFITAAGLLGAVTLPLCLTMSGAARPLIGFVYGPRWLPAAQPLVWLGALASLQIFFELSYDYFVVLARTRVVFTMQLAWLIVLIPSLVAGAREGGIWGLALAEAAVAAGVILPWYLRELRRVGIGPRALAARMRLPLAGGALAALAAAAAARLVPGYLAALAVSGTAGLAIIAALGYHMRSDLRVLRQRGGGPAAATAPPVAARQDVTDHTGPIPLAVDPAGVPEAGLDVPPLYRATVESLRWDPARSAAQRSQVQRSQMQQPQVQRPQVQRPQVQRSEVP
jgi:PST family polysaccharide transporter